MKENRSLAGIFVITAVSLFFADILINLRISYQAKGGPHGSLFLGALPDDVLVFLTDNVSVNFFVKQFLQFISLKWLFGIDIKWGLLVQKVLYLSAYLLSFIKTPAADKKPNKSIFILAGTGPVVLLSSYFMSPFFGVVQKTVDFSVDVYIVVTTISFVLIIYSFSKIAKWIAYSFSQSLTERIENDPFGESDRRFQQEIELKENKYSVNIPYWFINSSGKRVRGWINFINIFRAVQVLGTPGSGKSFAFFLPAIMQLIKKGFSMCIYDFKYPDLSAYAYNCLQLYKEEVRDSLKSHGVNAECLDFKVINFDNVTESERCNLIPPDSLNDFTIGAYGAANIFLVALNRSWSTKDGEFFPESAKNITAACIWALKLYKGGKNCSIPHLIEFLSMRTEDIIEILIKLKDGSLKNVIRPFEEAKIDNALEQLQGQMGTVRIALSRLTSPVVYWVLTDDPEANEKLDLNVNRKEKPTILCLGNSSENQMVNNIFYSLFIVQMFRLINKKGRHPFAGFFDEAVTLSFPKGTLDTIIATGRGHLISIWLGYQDLSQLIRDFTRDVAEALFKMIGNTVAGSVQDDTADRLSKRVGKMRIKKRSESISAEGEISYSYSETTDYAIPESFWTNMSQGTFGGKLVDNFGEKLKTKAFYGEVDFTPPFDMNNMLKIPKTSFWKKVIERDCYGMNQNEINEYIQMILDRNFERVCNDIEEMRADVLGR